MPIAPLGVPITTFGPARDKWPLTYWPVASTSPQQSVMSKTCLAKTGHRSTSPGHARTNPAPHSAHPPTPPNSPQPHPQTRESDAQASESDAHASESDAQD